MKYEMGFTCGTFDLMHAGHVLMFEEAKQQCEFLVVGMQTDPTIDRPSKNKPVESVTERYIKLKSIKWIDEVIPYTTERELIDLLKMLPIGIRIVGADYVGKDFTGRDYCLENGIHIHYNSRNHNLSSTDIRSRVAQATPKITEHPREWIEP